MSETAQQQKCQQSGIVQFGPSAGPSPQHRFHKSFQSVAQFCGKQSHALHLGSMVSRRFIVRAAAVPAVPRFPTPPTTRRLERC
mmetsp:Transcript_58613/g.138030  ORF Transcript_58613/g.138030 Transcript_58613/m.138030 type:complete len:84 (+) Transcript_58613:129-380(+)